METKEKNSWLDNYHYLRSKYLRRSLAKENRPEPAYFIIVTILFLVIILYTFWAGLVTINNVDLMQATQISTSPDINTSFNDFIDIFANNSSKSLLSIVEGVLFGVFPIHFIYVNSQIIGIVSALVYSSWGASVTLAGLLPHGLTESVAMIMSASYGLWLGVKFFRFIFLREAEKFKFAFFSSLIQYVYIIIPLLIISALIESFITPHLIHIYYK